MTNLREQVLEQLIELAKPLPEYEILLSILGIAETTTTSVIGELGDIRRFKSANQINAFIGIDLKHYELGDFLGQEHITKRGNPYARKILYKCIHNIASASHTILAISQISMRDEKDNRRQLQPSHTRLPLYIISFKQCITSLRITNFTVTL